MYILRQLKYLNFSLKNIKQFKTLISWALEYDVFDKRHILINKFTVKTGFKQT